MKIAIFNKLLMAGCLSFISSLACAETFLIDFGGGSGTGTNTFNNGWNQTRLASGGKTQTIAGVLNTDGEASGLTITVTPPQNGTGTLLQTSLSLTAALANASIPLWQSYYGAEMTNTIMTTGWTTTYSVGVATSQSMTISGLQAGTYTASAVVAVLSLSNGISIDELPVLISGAGIVSANTNVYMTSQSGGDIDLGLEGADIEDVNVTVTGVVTISWEFQLESASDVTFAFNPALLRTASATGIGAFAITDGYQINPESEPIPEPGTSVLGLTALGLLTLRRRK